MIVTAHPAVARILMLALCAWLWGLLGLGVALGASNNAPPSAFHSHIPISVQAALWLLPAVGIAFTAATGRGTRWTIVPLLIAPCIRIASYAWAWVTYFLTDGAQGLAGGWYAALIHVTFPALVVLAALLCRDSGEDGGHT